MIQGAKAQNKDIQELINQYPRKYFGFSVIDQLDDDVEKIIRYFLSVIA